MINYRVLGLDPGGTTGWCTYSATRLQSPVDDNAWEYSVLHPWHGGALTGKHHKELKDLLGTSAVQHFVIVCERFTDRSSGHAVDLAAREYIGVVEQFVQERAGEPNAPQLVMQMPGHAKPFVKDQNLRNLGLWTPGHSNRHFRDAKRHVLYYLINTERRTDLLRLGWPNR